MKIALAQLNYTIGDIAGNKAKIIEAVEHAKLERADLVIFAEQALSGTPAFDLLLKTTFLEQCEEAAEEIACHCDTVAALVGLPVLTEHGTVSAAALMRGGRIERYFSKRHISARREMGFISEGEGPQSVDINGHLVAVVIGNDLQELGDVDHSIETVVSINARRYGKTLLTFRYNLMHQVAFVNSRNIVLVNQVGGAGEIVYDGTSGALNARGELVLCMKSFEEDFAMYDTDTTPAILEVPYDTATDRTRMIYKAAVLGLRDYFHKNNYTKACVGLSGGIDSSVVACLAVEALGRENVRGLMMPSQFSTDHSVHDAKLLAENLNIRYNVLPISEAYKSIMDTLKPVTGGTEFDSTEENIQARIRTVMLMAVQNKTGYMLLNCSNKSENALGLCTLYGDTAGTFSVTGDLYKSEMYDLARYINRYYGDLIPESILTKEPSSELHPGQKDSDTLPAYEVLDAILLRMIEEGQHREEIINAGFDAQVVEKVHAMVMYNEKKRYQFPPVLRLSPCAFKHELLMPLINKYGE